MKKIYWIIIIILSAATCTAASIAIGQARHLKSLKHQVSEQSAVIDSLLKRRMTVFDVSLNVTDRSKISVYGRYNKGTINVPSERTYTLEVDSVNMTVK